MGRSGDQIRRYEKGLVSNPALAGLKSNVCIAVWLNNFVEIIFQKEYAFVRE